MAMKPELPPELEAELAELFVERGNTAILKRLREAGYSFLEGKQWLVEFHAALAPRKPCPYCGEPLRADEARQCFLCGTDWHDPNRVIRRGTPS